MNSVYERFFQGFSPKEADTHGIVYTPQPIVDFMVRSVEDILKKEFGRSLSDKGVHILDPFVGTGNFITRVMKEIKTTALPYKYENELHCNEVMLLPVLRRQHEHRTRVSGADRRVPAVSGNLPGGYVRTGGARAELTVIQTKRTRTSAAPEGCADLRDYRKSAIQRQTGG